MNQQIVAALIQASAELDTAEEFWSILRKLKDEIFTDRIELLRVLKENGAKVGLVLANGQMIEGVLDRVEDDKIRIEEMQPSPVTKHKPFMETWPHLITAVRFQIATDFKSLEFEPYRKEQVGYYGSKCPLDRIQRKLYNDTFDFLLYLLYGQQYNCWSKAKITVAGSQAFEGPLCLVDPRRVVMELTSEEHQGGWVYVDIHPLMISAVQHEIGRNGFPPGEC